MNAIQDIIHLLTDAEKKEFILYLKAKNKRHDTKNIQLFNILKTDDINYKNNSVENKPALYALRKRLYESLLAFLADKRFEADTSEEREALKWLHLSRTLFEHSEFKTAFRVLKKAEDMALQLERFNLLNEIYHTRIQYAYLDITVSFSDVIEKYQRNQEKFLQEEKLNLGYASLRLELCKIKEGDESFDFEQTIQDTVARYGISLNEILTFKSLYQILYIVNEYAALRNNYSEVIRFVDQGFRFIEDKKVLTERHLFYHIQILYFMANLLFRNKRFDQARHYLDKMEQQMNQQEKLYCRQFYNRWIVLKSLNENYSGNAEHALQLLRQVIAKSESTTEELLDVQLSYAVFSFQQLDLKSVQQALKQFTHSDVWYEKKQGKAWAIKKNLVEILLHVELQNFDFVHSRMTSFKRRYKQYLNEINEERVLVFLSLVEKCFFEPEYVTSKDFLTHLEQSFVWKAHKEEDLFVMSFYAWLKAKIEKKDIYEVTLELVKTD